ncbi:MAG TPA: cupin domain-containing protein [Chloroflexota bacterium]|nr:cupin domain-containing protein [Chloroflexota bacterium]
MSETMILSPASITPVDRGGGVRTWPLVTAGLGATNFLNGITEFDPGASLPLHSHNCEESVVVLAGNAGFEFEGQVREMAPNDTTWVPAGVVHRFLNLGSAPMRILWTYASTEATRTIASTGETHRIAFEAARR